MSRFKVSKYKNALCRPFKKEDWIHDLNVGSNFKSNSTHIKASCHYVAFIHSSSCSGAAAILPLNSSGRFSSFPTVSGHTGSVTDFDFSPFDDNALVTGGEEGVVKMWQLPSDPSQCGTGQSFVCSASIGPMQGGGHIEKLSFNPVASNVLGGTAGKNVYIWDMNTQQEKYMFSQHDNVVQSFSWDGAGNLLTTIAKKDKQKQLIVIDPRANAVVTEAACHSMAKESSVLWLGDTSLLVSAGYSASREYEVLLWDSCKMSNPINRQTLGSGSGTPMLFYDEDTLMLFVAMKGETSVCYYELSDNKSLSLAPNGYRGTETLKGACLIPKRAVDVMSCEIDRLLLLTQNAITPVGVHIQRKSYTEFHGDLYPDTAGPIPALTSDEWFANTGNANKRGKVSLNPFIKEKKPASKPVAAVKTSDGGRQEQKASPDKITQPKQDKTDHREKQQVEEQVDAPVIVTTPAAAKALNIVRTSKVKHVQGYMAHKSTYLEKLPSLSASLPGECDGLSVNSERAAVALSGAGNRIAIFELSKPGRVDVGGDIGAVQNVAGVMDFTFDPFDSKRLVVACDDASIKVWDIPDNLSGTLKEPSFVLQGHYEKSNVIKYHPLAQHILASAGYDCKIFIWNVQTQSIVITLESLPEPVFCLSWSPDGKSLGSVGKDHIIRLYKPLESTSPIATGKGPSGSRGARMVWLDDTSFAISGFEKSSDRQLSLYALPDISNPVSSVTLSSSPAILIPHYDPDIKLFYLTGKGDTSVLTVEYCPDVHPHLFSTASFPIGTSHQALKFLPKTLCNVKTVEVARGIRLCKSTIEPLGFKIPRVKMEYFQDDLYCDTSVTWEPVMSPDEWLGGVTKKQKTISLRPEGMKLLSEMPVQAPSSSAKKYSSHVLHEKTDEEKKEELITAMMSKMNDKDSEPLPQDDMDGVDSDEWDDY